MPQLLPPFPNLEHLKGQAKDVLRVVRRRQPSWKLAHAQHALARGYGFTSWPDLKTHIESIQHHTPASTSRRPDGVRQHVSGRHPLVGTWVLNVSRSTAQASPQLHEGVMLEFSMTGSSITMTQVVLDPCGRDMAIKLAIRTDCSSQMVRFGQGFVLEVWLAGSQRLEAVIRNGEHIVSRGTYDVSPDGRTLSFITQATHIVFDRVGAR